MANSLADLYLRGGQQRAQTALSLADIAAQAQQRTGDTWGRAFATIGDIASRVPGQIQQAKDAQVERGIRDESLKTQQQGKVDQANINKLIAAMPRDPQTGALVFEPGELSTRLAAANIPIPKQAEVLKSIGEVNNLAQSFAKTRREHSADLANFVLSSDVDVNDPQSVELAMAFAIGNGIADQSVVKQYNDAIAKGMQPKAFFEQARGLSDKYKQDIKAFSKDQDLVDVNAVGGPQVVREGTPKAKTQAELAQDAADPNSPTAAQSAAALKLIRPDTQPSLQSKDVLINGKRAIVNFNPKDGKMYDPSTGKEVTGATPIPPASSGTDSTKKSDLDDLADTVIASPGLWDQLTPSAKTAIAPRLKAKGYEDFGKPMTDGAAKQIAESESAIQSLQDLRGVLQRNEQYIGPLAGLQAINPYSDARKAQADIDLVRQRVGKALEGGVLRKEDEEKYKKILSTLRDEPSTAIYKVDQLIKSITRDMENFKHQQRIGGKRVGASAGPVTVNGKDGQPYTFPNQKAADDFKAAGG